MTQLRSSQRAYLFNGFDGPGGHVVICRELTHFWLRLGVKKVDQHWRSFACAAADPPAMFSAASSHSLAHNFSEEETNCFKASLRDNPNPRCRVP